VNAAEDHGECPVDRRYLSDDARRAPPRDMRRILVVDDTAATREMFALYVRSRGSTSKQHRTVMRPSMLRIPCTRT
jgi:hypothetical protein